jgi:Protein of unknown function (DUF1757)
MTSLFPHAEYAEDQPYSKTILTFHVLRAGATAGAIISIPIAAGLTLYRGQRTLPAFLCRSIICSARGTVYGIAFSGIALGIRMWSREKIEWQDRSWRLLENKGQVEVDNFVLGGMAGAAMIATGAVRGGRLPPGLERRIGTTLLGAAGLGSVGGTIGYLGWRHWIKGGRFDNEEDDTNK